MACLVLAHGPPLKLTLITYSCLLTCFDAGSGSSVDHTSGGVGGVLASLTTMVKECCGSYFIIILPLYIIPY